jgi:adenylate cyclase
VILWLLIAGGYVLLSVSGFVNQALWMEIVRPITSMFLAMLFVFIYRFVEEDRKKKYIQGMFQHYLSASVVQELLKNPKMLNLGGERRTATAFFSDIISFTTVSENLSPEDLVAQLNEYLSAMGDIVLKYEGYIDKYEGDAIMAVFGVPLYQSDHAKRACLAALEMQQELDKLRSRWRMQERPEFHVRIGINSGPMIAGNIGGKHRFDYTVIGDAVNLALRLEGANTTYGTKIIISESTKDLLKDELITRELDFLRVKGKTEPVRVYELVAKTHKQLDKDKLVIIDLFSKGLKEYRNYKWDAAIAAFNRILGIDPEDGPALTYIERCEFYKNNLVPEDWDGVFEMKTK